MPIQFSDTSLGSRLNDGMNLGGGVQLPFTAPVFWTINGNPALRQLGGAQYFGGWACDAGDFDDAMRQWSYTAAPKQFVLSDMVSNDGKSYQAYTARNLLIAPICYRRAWITQEGTRVAEYTKGARQHVQTLAVLAYRNGETHMMGPVVLSAKGFQAQNLLNSFGAWNKHTQNLRRKLAPDVPAWCFLLSIGTFGTERKQILVGQGAQHPITPIGAYLPEALDEKTLESLFVGEDVAKVMLDYMTQAAEWRTAWGQASQDQIGRANQTQNGEPEFDDFVPVPPADLPY